MSDTRRERQLRNMMATETNAARAYIDTILEINRKHGMGSSEDFYEEAVEATADATRRLTLILRRPVEPHPGLA